MLNVSEAYCCKAFRDHAERRTGCFDEFWTPERCCKSQKLAEDQVRAELLDCGEKLQAELLDCMQSQACLGGCLKCRGLAEGMCTCPAVIPAMSKVNGRDNELNRVIWCMAILPSVRNVVDVFLANGFSTNVIAHGLSSTKPNETWHVGGFEMDTSMSVEAVCRLKAFGGVSFWRSSGWGGGYRGYRSQNYSGMNGIDDVRMTVVNSKLPDDASRAGALEHICGDQGPDLVVLDPDFQVLMEKEFLLLEHICKPRAYIINNINLPAHGGWMREYLLNFDDWLEVLRGSSPDFSGVSARLGKGSAETLALRSWTLLIRGGDGSLSNTAGCLASRHST